MVRFPYLVAVSYGGDTHIYSFPTRHARTSYIERLKQLIPAFSYATAETHPKPPKRKGGAKRKKTKRKKHG